VCSGGQAGAQKNSQSAARQGTADNVVTVGLWRHKAERYNVRGTSAALAQWAADVSDGSLASDLTCQRHVRLDRDLGHAGGTGEEFRAGIQRAVDKGWLARHEFGTYVMFTQAGAELFA
jgi:hypothetical protein